MTLETDGVVVRPVARLTPRNLKALLDDMGLQPGVHLVADLYTWYLGMCEEEDAQPISKKAFGMSLAAQGCTPTSRRIDGKLHRGWMIPRSRFRDTMGGEPKPSFSPESRHPTLAHPEGT